MRFLMTLNKVNNKNKTKKATSYLCEVIYAGAYDVETIMSVLRYVQTGMIKLRSNELLMPATILFNTTSCSIYECNKSRLETVNINKKEIVIIMNVI